MSVEENINQQIEENIRNLVEDEIAVDTINEDMVNKSPLNKTSVNIIPSPDLEIENEVMIDNTINDANEKDDQDIIHDPSNEKLDISNNNKKDSDYKKKKRITKDLTNREDNDLSRHDSSQS